MSKYEIKSNLSEKQIEADVAAYFGWCSQGMPFRLLDTDELETGADKEYHPKYGGVIYMQFKKSGGLEPISKVPLSGRKNMSKKEEIRKFRDENKLDDDPTLYFKLRDKAKTAIDFQHNILKKHHSPPNSYAIYVAPLILDKGVYYQSLFDSCYEYGRYLLDPFYWQLKCIPFLRNHVSIVPHVDVFDSNHYYAYSQAGTDISWHSPSILEHEPRRLSDFIYNLFEDKKREEGYIIQQIVNNIIEIAKNYQVELPFRDFPFRDFPLRDFPFNEYEGEPILLIKKYGEWLKFNYNIKQFLIVRNQNY
ncbi:hypothetical protein [Neisseria sicca]|uniref:hypothetical protein n=1 Tax=Neisseria sicca TaxID=490 RepID=UPI0002F27673|nr:hypothetical protein [Neisseria sicca]